MGLDLRDKKFLIIDDFSDMRGMLRHMVESYGVADVDTASNGKEAVAKIAKKPYDIILCDYNLGEGQDGQQVLEEVKHRQLIRFSTVFIMITAENTMQMVIGAVEYHPDDYLSKPFNKHQLKHRLEKVIARKSDFEEIERAIEKRRIPEAIALCAARIDQAPKNITEFYRLQAELLLQQKEYQEAGEIYHRVLAQRDVPWAQVGLGRVQYELGRYAEARETFQSIIDQNKNHVEAHDWLARTLVAVQDLEGAEQILISAAKVSPKSILRQMALGDIAIERKNYKIAERAFRKAVDLGRHSVYRTPVNYIKQARAVVHSSAKDAFKVLHNLKKEFRKDASAQLHATVTESVLYKGLGREDEAAAAFRQASEMFDAADGKVAVDVALEMAKASFVNGDQERGNTIMKQAVGNHHDDAELLLKAQKVFEEVGMAREGEHLIQNTRDRVARLNNDGVRLAEQGRLEDAIELFCQALEELPDNKTVNMNAAMVFLKHIESHGKNDQFLFQARQYLDRVREKDPADATLTRLTGMYERLVRT